MVDCIPYRRHNTDKSSNAMCPIQPEADRNLPVLFVISCLLLSLHVLILKSLWSYAIRKSRSSLQAGETSPREQGLAASSARPIFRTCSTSVQAETDDSKEEVRERLVEVKSLASIDPLETLLFVEEVSKNPIDVSYVSYNLMCARHESS